MVSGNPAKKSITYYHGGMPGIPLETRLLSKSQAARQGRTEYWDLRSGIHSPDHVYFTTDLDLARSFAHALRVTTGLGMERRGSVYAVRPTGPIEADPDYPEFDDVFMASSATIIAVVQETLQLTRAEETRPFALRQRWASGPYVDADGFVQPNETMQQAGWNPALLRMIGPWVPRDDLGDELSRLAMTQTDAVLNGSPGIGGVDRGSLHKTVGLSDQAINTLCLTHYGSPAAFRAALQRLTADGTSAGDASAEPRRSVWQRLRARLAGQRR